MLDKDREKLIGLEQSENTLEVEFADGIKCIVHKEDLEQIDGNLRLAEASLPSSVGVTAPQEEGEEVLIPWEFFRRRCDEDFVQEEKREAQKVGRRVGDYIRKLRKENDLTQEELAEIADLSRATVNRIENGQNSPTYATLSRLASALGYGTAQHLLQNFRGDENRPVRPSGTRNRNSNFDSSIFTETSKEQAGETEIDKTRLLDFSRGVQVGAYSALIKVGKELSAVNYPRYLQYSYRSENKSEFDKVEVDKEV